MVACFRRVLEIDPDHKRLFLNPAFLKFGQKLKAENEYPVREWYRILDGIVLLDAMGDLDAWQELIDETVAYTGLPILERKEIGLDGLKSVLVEALDRNRRKQCPPAGKPENEIVN